MYLIINIEQYIFIWTQKIYFEKSFLCNILYNNSYCEKSICLSSEGTITYDRWLVVVRGGAGRLEFVSADRFVKFQKSTHIP